jgi:hypothetical protein
MRLSVTRTAKICPIEIAANISACVAGKIAQLHGRPYGVAPVIPCSCFTHRNASWIKWRSLMVMNE